MFAARPVPHRPESCTQRMPAAEHPFVAAWQAAAEIQQLVPLPAGLLCPGKKSASQKKTMDGSDAASPVLQKLRSAVHARVALEHALGPALHAEAEE